MRVGFMQRSLNRRANEAALPTYLLHFPIVIAISALVVELPLGLWPKAFINVAFGVAATLVVVGVAVRIPVLRPLLGLRRVHPGVAPLASAGPAVVPAARG